MTSVSIIPISTATGLVSEAQIRAYIDDLFRHVDWSEGGVISLLGIGEKGTDKEGKFRERKFVDPRSAFCVSAIKGHVDRWAAHGVAAFIVPAVVRDEAEAAGDVTLERIQALTAIVVDIDSGDTGAKWEHAETHLGSASFTVLSGGVTDSGQPKRHCYWLLSEPAEDVERVAALRKVLAAKIGGDQSFGRATQVIRLPGSVYAKGGQAKPVQSISGSEVGEAPRDFHLDELAEAIEAMPAMEGVIVSVTPGTPSPMSECGSFMDFMAGAGKSMTSNAIEAMQRDVHEGGDTDRNRWSEFSAVAGFNIKQVRLGLMSLEEAAEAAYGWMLSHMVPPWPRERFQQEFIGILNHDMKANGPLQEMQRPGAGISVSTMETIDTTDDLLSWAVVHRSSPEPKARRMLVDGLVFAGKRHMVVAEGGAGKTFLCMDLALKLAAAGEGSSLTWMGQAITPEANGGTVIIMTGEDDIEELDIRWNALDSDGSMRRLAGERLIALPLDNLGGAFPLVSHHPATREAIASERWGKLYRAMHGIHQRGGRVSAVIIDTLNATLHGEENSAVVIGEYVRAVAPICGELKAALVVTHHVRKAGDEPIRDVDEMRAAIRGSTALPNAMRMVMGFWAAHDWQKRMKAMGLPPERGMLYMGGVLKANMPEAMKEPKTLLRQPSGLLEDVTLHERSSRGSTYELEEWLIWCIREYADHERLFFTRTDSNSVHNHRAMFHPKIAVLTRQETRDLIDRLLTQRRLVQRSVEGSGSSMMNRLDVPECLHIDRFAAPKGKKHKMLTFDHVYFDDGYGQIRAKYGHDDAG
ncbi:hypothetical protein BSL82_15745 [Tardibacter chloracetimidivorans]|uniref:Uncharacterized protein n=1 Tax=Tardibacter chloracetimidivorans TaxID=1921510 RepID=A0A1L3ZY44_9SPHN|nr:AAA family ATPase [Tardibacter chloracetimidivorans]API60558.1 hypothetical protein BSL82_15745 [Tardibacter chloracetimidivorans]